MIVDPQLPRALWPTGHIVKVHPSPDGHIRSADVKVKDRTYTRPVARLVILPALPAEDDSHPLSNVKLVECSLLFGTNVLCTFGGGCKKGS